MRDPVVTADGHAYERYAITQWLRTHETSPATGLPLPHPGLVPVHALRCAVADWLSQQGGQVAASASAPAASGSDPGKQPEKAVDMTSQAVKTSVVFIDGRWRGRSELRRGRRRGNLRQQHPLSRPGNSQGCVLKCGAVVIVGCLVAVQLLMYYDSLHNKPWTLSKLSSEAIWEARHREDL